MSGLQTNRFFPNNSFHQVGQIDSHEGSNTQTCLTCLCLIFINNLILDYKCDAGYAAVIPQMNGLY